MATNNHGPNHIFDVLIIGGGPAGLAAATGLARQLYDTVVFDSGVYRNDRASTMHNVPGWDHASPADLRAKIRSDLKGRYSTVRFESVGIDRVERIGNEPSLFKAVDCNEKVWTGRKLMLATGVRDLYPEIPGYDVLWGRGVYHCLFCHGYEDREAPSAGVLAVGNVAKCETALHMAYMARRLAKKVVIYTNAADDVAEEISTAIKPGFGFEIDRRRIKSLAKGKASDSDVTISFEDGDTVTEGFVVHKPKTEINGSFACYLQLELTDDGDIKTFGTFAESSMSGVFAGGDCGSSKKSVLQAMAQGALCASGISSQLQVMVPED